MHYCLACELEVNEASHSIQRRMWSPHHQAFVSVRIHLLCRQNANIHASHGLAELYRRLVEYGNDPRTLAQFPRYLGNPIINGVSVQPKEVG